MVKEQPACQTQGKQGQNVSSVGEVKCNDDFPWAACNLQSCLNKNTYSPDKCDNIARAFYECCLALEKPSEACPDKKMCRRWLDKHVEQK